MSKKKRVFAACVCAALAGVAVGLDEVSPVKGTPPPERQELIPLPLGAITARGWIRTLLERSRDGMGGHFGELDVDQFEKPYRTRDYNAKLHPDMDKDWPNWCAEMAAEYRLAQLELAVTLGDDGLLKKFRACLEAALALQEPDGYLGSYRKGDDHQEDFNAWGCHFFYRALLLEYSRTGEKRILDALHRGLLWFVENWAGDKKTDYVAPTILWPMVEVYKLTGDRRLLSFCEDYAKFLDERSHWDPRIVGELPAHAGGFDRLSFEWGGFHLVAYAVRAQLPGIVSLANGVTKYRDASVAAYDNHVSRVGWQATYVPTSHFNCEFTGPAGCVRETEYCNFVCWMEYLQWLARITGEARFGDAIERMTFNSAMGARKKDERAIAYNSSPNQFRATTDSAAGGCMPYYEAYTPCLFAACCPAQSLRLMPSYLLKSVMRSRAGDLVVNAYGPCHVEAKDVALDFETRYPFEDSVKIHVRAANAWTGALRLRVPVWTKGCLIRRNGANVEVKPEKGWVTLAGPWTRDELDVRFRNEPVVRAAREVDMDEPLRVVEYGPLVFAQPLNAVWTPCAWERPTRPLPNGWTWFNATCAEKPAIYAMPVETAFDASKIRVKRQEMSGYPWENSPLRLSVPMVRAAAAYPADPEKLQHNVAPVCNPAPADAGAQVEEVEFVPMGATNLRLTCFPLAGRPVENEAAAAKPRPQIPAKIFPPDHAHRLSTRAHICCSSFAASPKNGRFWSCWFTGVTCGEDENNYIVLATSTDEGRTWKEVVIVDPDLDGPRRVFDSQLWVSPDGRLRWTWTDRVGNSMSDPTQDQLWLVTLDAENEPPAVCPTPKYVGRGVMCCKPTVLANGEILLPSSWWKAETSARFYSTRDFDSFELVGGVTLPRDDCFLDEHQIVQLKDGTLWCHVRGHGKRGGLLESYSKDNGRTWSEPQIPSGIRNTSTRRFLTRLASGNLLFVKNGPIDQDVGRKELTAYLSQDDGKTWSAGLMLDERAVASYPDGQQLANGRIALVYDYNVTTDKQIPLVIFTEADVLAGARERIVRRMVTSPEGHSW